MYYLDQKNKKRSIITHPSITRNEYDVEIGNKRLQLERTNAMLNQKLKKEKKKRAVGAQKMMEENTILTK